MSWPADGEPRFVTASIHGAEIQLRNVVPKRTRDEHYVYDRANCHRIVFRCTAGMQRGPMPLRRTAAQEVAERCDALNLRPDTLRARPIA